MPDTADHPTALISWSHMDASWAAASTPSAVQEARRLAEERKDAVLRLSAVLRSQGVDAELDLHHLSEAVDWTRWGPRIAMDSDFVLVVVTPGWKDAWESRGDPTRGAGAAAEADVLRSLYAQDREAFLRKVRLVLLPGGSSADIPNGLHGVPRYPLATLDVAGVRDLMRSLTRQEEHPKAALGPLPVLPPSVTPPEAGTQGEREGLLAALAALPVPNESDPAELPWYRERERAAERIADMDARPAPQSTGLVYQALTQPVAVPWRETWVRRSGSTEALVTLHIVPVPSHPIPARQMAAVAAALPSRLRRAEIVDPAAGLDVDDDENGVSASFPAEPGYLNRSRLGTLRGVRVHRSGCLSVWHSLPTDGLSNILDDHALTDGLRRSLLVAGAVGVTNEGMFALAVEMGPMILVARVPMAEVGRGGPRTLDMNGADLRVEPDEVVSATAVSHDALEAASTLVDLINRAWRQRRR